MVTQMKYLEILDVTVVVFTTNHHYPLFYLDDTLQANSAGKRCLSSFYPVL